MDYGICPIFHPWYLFCRCGFRHEATLFKHKIMEKHNRDTALYVILNSDFEGIEKKLKIYLGIDLREKKHKVAEIDKPADIFPPVSRLMTSTGNYHTISILFSYYFHTISILFLYYSSFLPSDRRSLNRHSD